jgi:hypothetical protein
VDWILTIVLASGIMVPVADFQSERRCQNALTEWTLEPGVEIKCLRADGEQAPAEWGKKRRKHRRDDD